MKELILVSRGFLLAQKEVDQTRAAHHAYKLKSEFGVIVDKPELLSDEHVKLISNYFGEDIPASYYENPQDNSDTPNIEYVEGEEVTTRNFEMLVDEEIVIRELWDIFENLTKYQRAWSESERETFIYLYDNRYITDSKLLSKDNAIDMYNKYHNAYFAKSLDKKDVVKMSVEMKGELKQLSFTKSEREFLSVALANAYAVPLTKKQAKYLNTLNKKVANDKYSKESNVRSPYKAAKQFLKQGDVVKAAEVFGKNGSLLERNILWLLSRAKDEQEVKGILDHVKVNNPAVSLQFIQSLTVDKTERRTFSFYKNGRKVRHVETDKEFKNRKSKLSSKTINMLKIYMLKKIENYFEELPKLGKIYVEDLFEKIAVPLSTTASMGGLSVLPKGSRLPLSEDYIRTFCYWNGPRDIDTSLLFIKDNQVKNTMYFGNYRDKKYGDDALFSGDDVSNNGSEYYDLKLQNLRDRGIDKILYVMNGYGSKFDTGEIYCGYQNKKDLHTNAWSSKNMALKLQIKGESNAYVGFAIDLENNEMVILNELLESGNRVASEKDLLSFEKYLNSDYVALFNVKKLASLRASELVTDPKEADIVFSNTYVRYDADQKVIRSNDVEKLVALIQ